MTRFDDQMTTDQAARYLGVSKWTLKSYRYKRTGPVYYEQRLGEVTRVFYRKGDLDIWLKQQEPQRVDPAA